MLSGPLSVIKEGEGPGDEANPEGDQQKYSKCDGQI